MRQSISIKYQSNQILLYLTIIISSCACIQVYKNSGMIHTEDMVHLKFKNTIDLSNLIEPGFYLSYKITDEPNSEQNQRITFGLETPRQWNSWLGIGMHYLMRKSNMLIFEHIDDDTQDEAIVQRNSEEDTFNSLNSFIDLYEASSTSYGFPSRVKEESLILHEHFTSVTTRRIIFSCNFFPNQEQLISIAIGNTQKLAFHGRRSNRFIIRLEPGIATDLSDEVVVPSFVADLHRILLYYVWGFGADIGIFLVRYFKGWKYYIQLHGLVFGVLILLTVILETMMLLLNQHRIKAIYSPDIYLHYILSCIMLGVIFVQLGSGLRLRNRINSLELAKDKVCFELKMLKRVHAVLGIMLYGLGKFIVITGYWSFRVLESSSKTQTNSAADAYLVFSGILIIWMIVEWLRRQGVLQFISKFQFKPPKLSYSESNQLLQLLQSQVSTHEIAKKCPNIKYAIVDDRVYNIDRFTHPGGQYLLQFMYGKDLHRYLNGQSFIEGFASSKDSFRMQFTHPSSVSDILRNRLIGTLDYKNRNVILMNDRNEKDLDQTSFSIHIPSEGPYNQLKLTDSHIEMVSQNQSNSYRFTLVSGSEEQNLISFQNPSVKIKNTMNGLSWMGLHFSISNQLKPQKNRLYTTVLCFSKENQIRLKQIEQVILNSSRNVSKAKKLHELQYLEDTSEYLSFYVKKEIKQGSFAKQLWSNIGGQYIIKGPFGRGLELPDQLDGQFCIFANGTGILPFLDLFNYILNRNYLKYISLIQNKYEKIDYPESNISIQLFASFRSLHSFPGSQIIFNILRLQGILGELMEQTSLLQEYCSNNRFELNLRISNRGDATEFEALNGVKIHSEYFNQTLIERIRCTTLAQADRIYISGSQDFMKGITGQLRSFSEIEQKLYFP